jgi:hypothetical protein
MYTQARASGSLSALSMTQAVFRFSTPFPESKHTMETMIESGALRKVVVILAFMVEHVDEVPRETRLIDFCKMLENLTTLLANSSNEQKLFLDELRSVPGKDKKRVRVHPLCIIIRLHACFCCWGVV